MKNFFNAAFKNPVSISIISLFATLLIWWIWSYFIIGDKSSFALNLWSDLYYLIALLGALFGFMASKRWGGIRTCIGQAIIAFSIGLLLQCFGNLAYNYYIRFLNIDIPYPSIGDIGYFGSGLFYIYGALMLAKISKTKLSLKLIGSKIYTIFIPLATLVLSYFIFLQNYTFDWSDPIKIFLDFAIPFIGIIPVSLALLALSLSRQKLGGAVKLPIIFFILALISQYLSDYVFLYLANNGTYFAGDFNDLMYAVSYILMTLSLILLSIWPKLLSD